jgi:ribosome-binding protein aMBF1 (putative translation factor)
VCGLYALYANKCLGRNGRGKKDRSVKNRLVIHLGACVRELRQEAGFSQVELAERCGFYQTYLSRLERGIANPSLHAMEVVANTLGLTLYELFDRVRARQARDALSQDGPGHAAGADGAM